MATTTNPVSGSSSAVLSTDRSGANASANRYSLSFKQSDSATGLFEELLSLPIFDSTVLDSETTKVSTAVIAPVESNEEASSTDSKNDLKDDDKKSSDDLTEATADGSVNVAILQQTTIVDTNTTTPKTEESSAIQTTSEPSTEPNIVSNRGSEKPTVVVTDKNSSITDPDVGPKGVPTAKSDLGLNNDSLAEERPDTTQVPSQVTTQVEPTNDNSANEIGQSVQASGETKPDSQRRKRTDEATAISSTTEAAFDNSVTGAPTVANEEATDERKQDSLPNDSLTNAENESKSEVESTSSRRAEFLNERRKESRFEGDADSKSQAQDQQRDAALDSASKANSTSDISSGITTNASFELTASSVVGEGTVSSSSGLSQGTSTVTNIEQASARASIAVSAASNASANNGASTSTNVTQTISNVGISGASAVPGTTAFTSSSGSSRGTAGSTGLTKYQEQRVLQRALAGIEQLQDGSSPVRIRLHPHELGSLQVTVRVENSQVIAAIEVEHSAAKQVLLENLPKLQASLKDQGITIADFRVEVVPPGEFSGATTGGFHQQQGQFRDGASSSQTSRYAEIARNRLEQVPVGAASGTPMAAWSRRDGNLDVNA